MPTTGSTAKKAAAGKNAGHVTQVIGSTFDAEFPEDRLPAIYNAVKIEAEHKGVRLDLTGEVQQHLGGGRVRCVALGSTDGLVRGAEVRNTGAPISVPVGNQTLGHIFNVLGDSLDDPSLEFGERWPIHRPAPAFDVVGAQREMFETGIKVIDLLEPYVQGGKIGMFGGAEALTRG